MLVAVPAADAASQTVSSSSLSWGVRTSFRSYIVATGGSITASDGATKDTGASTSPFTWAGAGGSYDPVTRSGSLDYAGKVVFSAPAHTIWNITITNPSVVLDGDATGTLVADVSYATGGTQAAPENIGTSSEVAIGTVSVGTPSVTGATSAYVNQAVTLTQAGSESFAGFYAAGDAMDPLTATATVQSSPNTVVVDTGTLAPAQVGKAYSVQLAGSGGQSPYIWSLATGNLPTGLSLSSTGAITGVPTTEQTSDFTVRATDAADPAAGGTKDLSLPVKTVVISTGALASAPVQKSYAATLAATGGKSSYTWSLAGGALPKGLALSTSGKVSGTPTVVGTFAFTARAQDSTKPTKWVATKDLSLTVAPMTVNAVTPPAGLVGKAYPSTTFKATGGKATVVWAVAAGGVPTGLKLSTGGVLSGTPTTAGTYTFTVRATDAGTPKNIATKQVGVTIAPLTLNAVTVPSGLVGKAFTSTTFKATGGRATLVWTVSEGALPSGLKLSTGGVLSGTPTAAATRNVTVKVTDASTPKAIATRAVTIVVDPMTVIPQSLPNGKLGTSYKATVKANGGKAALAWTVAAGALPAGLKLSSTGALSGKPTTAGTFAFTVQVTDGTTPKNSATRTFSITVPAP
ncbi:MAG: Ig family protein [Marmoricola sp.]|nr:Ig family protein [Marmoricola sp.]